MLDIALFNSYKKKNIPRIRKLHMELRTYLPSQGRRSFQHGKSLKRKNHNVTTSNESLTAAIKILSFQYCQQNFTYPL